MQLDVGGRFSFRQGPGACGKPHFLSRPWAEDLKANSSVGCVCKRLKREERSGKLELSTGCHARVRSCDADVTTLSHSFGKPNQYWGLESTPAMFLSMMRKRIMTDRSLSMSKIYSDRDYNPSKFEDLWGQDLYDIRILKGPECLLETDTQTELPFTPPSNAFQVSGELESDPKDVLITQLSLLDTGSRVHTDPFALLDWTL
jgi:hypothetical protein